MFGRVAPVSACSSKKIHRPRAFTGPYHHSWGRCPRRTSEQTLLRKRSTEPHLVVTNRIVPLTTGVGPSGPLTVCFFTVLLPRRVNRPRKAGENGIWWVPSFPKSNRLGSGAAYVSREFNRSWVPPRLGCLPRKSRQRRVISPQQITSGQRICFPYQSATPYPALSSRTASAACSVSPTRSPVQPTVVINPRNFPSTNSTKAGQAERICRTTHGLLSNASSPPE